MVRNWLDTTEAVAFAREIAEDIKRLFPATATPAKRVSVKSQKKLDALVRRTSTFAQEHPLNVYKKAKLLNTLKWELRDAGHDKALIDDIIALLTPVLTSHRLGTAPPRRE